jgi:hypothetical protein
VLGLGAASGSRAHYLVGYLNEPATKSSSLSFRSCSCRGLPSASTLPVSGGTSARSVWAAQSEKLHQSAALWKGPPELALLGPREMSDLTARWAKASLDQVAVTNRDFMSARPSQLEIRPPDFCLDCHPNGDLHWPVEPWATRAPLRAPARLPLGSSGCKGTPKRRPSSPLWSAMWLDADHHARAQE